MNTLLFERTEALLFAWAHARQTLRRSITKSLALPASSSISRMIEQQRVFSARNLTRGVRNARRTNRAHRVWQPNAIAKLCACGLIHAHASCPNCGTERPLTAAGNETRAAVRAGLKVELSSEVLTIDQIVNSLVGWQRQTLELAYVLGLPDRLAARAAQVEREHFTARRRATVAAVAALLAMRGEARVDSATPDRAIRVAL